MNWNKYANDMGLMVVFIAIISGISGFLAGFQYGTPVFDIKEIVWVETHNPIPFFDWECRMVPTERRELTQ